MGILKKYLTIASVSLGEDFAYRLNFLLWRLRMVAQLLVAFFLWQAVFDSHSRVFGYSRGEMTTYILMTQFIRPLTLSSRSIEVSSVIANGDLTNLVLKPINFFKYYFVRDLESKILNVSFALVEFILIVALFRPEINFPASITSWILFIPAIFLAIFIFFFLNLVLGFLAFWMPENSWAPRFLFFIFFDFFSGSLFPLDIFSGSLGLFMRLTPFYYLLFFPLSILIGRAETTFIITGFVIALAWVFILFPASLKIWKSGLKIYGAWGR